MKKNILWTILYTLLTLFFVLHHEIWADEAQVWLLAKNLSVPQLFQHLVNEGHPSFFYLLIMPFAKLLHGVNAVFSMQIICWLASVASVFLLLQFSPFKGFSKFAIVTSAGFLYYFPVIARSYSILPVLIFALAILYPKAKERPILYALVLAAIANTHVIMFAFCAILAAYFIYQNKKENLASSSIMVLSLIAVIIQLSGTMESNGIISFNFANVAAQIFQTVSAFFLNSVDFVYKNAFEPPHITIGSLAFAFTSFVLFLVLSVRLFIKDKKMGTLAVLSILFQFFIYIFSYKAMLYPTRIFCSYLILIFCYWVAFEEKKIQDKADNILIGIFFLLTLTLGVQSALLDLFNNYSSAKETAQFLEKNVSSDSIIVPSVDAFGLAIYLNAPDKRFYSVYKDRDIKYMIWYNPQFYTVEGYTELLRNNPEVQKHRTYVLVSSFLNGYKFSEILPKDYKLVFKSKPAIASGEAFEVYEFIGKY